MCGLSVNSFIRLARQPPRHGSELERDRQLRGQDASIWLGNRQTIYLAGGKAERDGLGLARVGPSRLDLGGTAGNTREQAERALVGLMRSNADGNTLLSPNCHFILFS